MSTEYMGIPPKCFSVEEEHKLHEQIKADEWTTINKILVAREKGSKVIRIYPQSAMPEVMIDFCATEIRSGERILITLPKTYTHFGETLTTVDHDTISDLTERYLGPEIDGNTLVPALPEDVFLAIRTERDMIVCDMYHV